jgi:hypothetical protein
MEPTVPRTRSPLITARAKSAMIVASTSPTLRWGDNECNFVSTTRSSTAYDRVYDRYYNFGHGGALKRPFIEQVNIPMLMYGEAERFEGAPIRSFFRDPANYRRLFAISFGMAIYSLWWFSDLIAHATFATL